MKKNARNILKLLIAAPLLMAFLLVLSPIQSDAAAKTTNYIGWWYDLGSAPRVKTNRTIEIEAGQSFELAPYFIHMKQTGYNFNTKYGDKLSMTFVSSKPSVASVKKKSGSVTAKKVGTTRITAAYKGKKYICTLKVKKRGSLGMTTTYKKLNSAAKTLLKYKNTKITSNNIAAILPKVVNYINQWRAIKKDVIYGFELTSKMANTNRLVLPSQRQVEEVESRISDYLYANDLSSTLKFTSVSGKGNSGTISAKLSKTPTKTQINIMQVLYRNPDKVLKLSSNTTFWVDICCEGYEGDDEDNPDYWDWSTKYYMGTCKIKAGSKSATITEITEGYEGAPVKLKKDYRYTIELNGEAISFVAK